MEEEEEKMTNWQKVRNILLAIIMIGLAVLLVLLEDSYIYISMILFVAMTLLGLKYLWFYITMARHMVSGRYILYIAVILLNSGIFMLSLYDDPHIFVVLYLVIYSAFKGAVEIIGGTNERKYNDPSWRFSFLAGSMNILLAIACLVFIRNYSVVTYIYGAGLVASAVRRIVTSLRKTNIVYIQ